jgi:cyclin-dependent kinase
LCPNLDEEGLNLLDLLLVYDPAYRLSAKRACTHPYFDKLHYENEQVGK